MMIYIFLNTGFTWRDLSVRSEHTHRDIRRGLFIAAGCFVFTAGIQEFLVRSVMQENMKRILVGNNTAPMAIVLSSAIFAALHVHLGFLFMAGAGILAGLEGILYEKQQSLFGVWIVHWVFGVSGTLLCLINH